MRLGALAGTISAAAFSTAWAQQAPATSDEIIVTATRRAESVQDIPLNIAAVPAAQIEEQGFGNLTELSAFVPGLHIINQGGHASHPIIVRGLNADPVGPNDGANDGGGTVATYVGEIPLFIDLKLQDLERVEVLLGPQGTLYGAGTLGGAIRYIPKKPQFDAFSAQLRGEAYTYSESDETSTDFGATVNIPVSDQFAIRASVDMLNDAGFIDYNFIVRNPGVSDADVFTPANLAPVADANDEETLSGRIALRLQPTNNWDMTLTYYFQNAEVLGRQISSHRGLIPVQEYVSTKRVRETFERNNELYAFEQTADLGFAELTSATGYSRYNDSSQRDQSDLLILLNPANSYYYYENFPTFTAFTRDVTDEETFSQEVRLVSTTDGPLSWIVGAFYNKFEAHGTSREFTPGFSQYLFDNYFYVGPSIRTDALEYISDGFTDLTESAIFGEIGYDLTPKLNVTLGGRYYTYDLKTRLAVDLPLLQTQLGRPDSTIVLNYTQGGQEDEGFLYKVNASYDFTTDLMAYATRSEGYRIGNSNDVAPCVTGGGPQTVCGLATELEYTADKTVNYEVGVRSEWFNRKLTVNGAAYFIQWEGPQVASATLTGAQPITINGSNAESMGFEVNFNSQITDHFSLRGAYSFNQTEFTADTRSLITVSNAPNGFLAPADVNVMGSPCFNPNLSPGDPQANCRISGKSGDRLPGSPEYLASLFAKYEAPIGIADLKWNASWAFNAVGDVLSRTGGRGGSLTLPSYEQHNATLGVSSERWTATLYANNVFDELIETGVTSSPLSNVTFTDDAGGTVFVRSFYTDVAPPRQVGIRVVYNFGG